MLFKKKAVPDPQPIPEIDDPDRDVADLIEEQRKKESVRVWRRGYCISQATYVMEDGCSAEKLIEMAKAIYRYVYQDEEER